MVGRRPKVQRSRSDILGAQRRIADLELRFEEMPKQAKELTCSCKHNPNNYVPYRELNDVPPLPTDQMPLGSYCKVCKKPYKYSIWVAIFQCESCESYYVPERYPVKQELCPECVARIPVRRRLPKPGT